MSMFWTFSNGSLLPFVSGNEDDSPRGFDPLTESATYLLPFLSITYSEPYVMNDMPDDVGPA